MPEHESNLAAVIEAMLFVAGGPTSKQDLLTALETDEVSLERALQELEHLYDSGSRGIRLKRFGAHVQLVTHAAYAPYIERMLQPVQRQSLSQAALETLSVVAYRQPVTRLDVEAVRGVKCDYSLQSLMQKGMICELGRKDTVGRPILYGTTDLFLSHFGLQSLDELPVPDVPVQQEAEESLQEILSQADEEITPQT